VENEIIVIDNELAIKKFKDKTLELFLKDVEKDALNFVGSTDTDKDRKLIISKAASVGKIKTTIEKAKKTLTEEARAFVTSVNAQGKMSFDFLTNLQAEVRKPVTEYEEAEKLRIEEERKAAEYIIDHEDALKEDELYDLRKEKELREEADRKKEETRIAKEEAEAEEKERVAREERIAKEAEEKAKLQAAKIIEDAKHAQIQAEKDKALAEERHKSEIEQAKKDKKLAEEKAELEKKEAIEKARKDAEERIKLEQKIKDENVRLQKEKEEKAAKNMNHRKNINREIYQDFLIHIPNEMAIKVTKLIVENKINHVSIGY